MSKIINPLRRKVGHIEIDIFDDNQTEIRQTAFGPLGQPLPMPLFDSASIMIQAGSGILVQVRDTALRQQQSIKEGTPANGQSDKASTSTE